MITEALELTTRGRASKDSPSLDFFVGGLHLICDKIDNAYTYDKKSRTGDSRERFIKSSDFEHSEFVKSFLQLP